jgi:branched-chain amino acid transport system permease protein
MTAQAAAQTARTSNSWVGPVRRSLSMGAIGGGAAVYMVAIGFITVAETISIVTGYLTLGTALLASVALATGYFATRGDEPNEHRIRTILSGLLTGLVGGAIFALFVAVARNVDLREVFPNISPEVIAAVSFDTESPLTWVVLAGGGALVALAGATLNLLSPLARKVIVGALITLLIMGILERVLRVMFTELGPLVVVADFLFVDGGLTVPGAIASVVISAVLILVWELRKTAVRQSLDGMKPGPRRQLRRGSAVVFLLFLIALPQIVGTYPSDVLSTVGLFLLLALGLNIVVGFAGLLDLGYVAFFAIGAYATAILTSPASFLAVEASFWVALLITIVLVAVAGVIIGAPVLRLRGDYLAIVTLGFGEIVRILVGSDWLKEYTGGAQGILQIPPPLLIGEWPGRDPQQFYYVVLGLSILAAFVAIRLAGSRVGRAWNAMREDEQVAAATGINTTNFKLLAFGLGAIFAGIGGALFASKIGAVFPSSFSILISITALSIIILGGTGSIRGVIVGALVLIGLPELLREFDQYRLLIYGVVLVAMMLLKPEGLLPNARRRLELHAGDEEEAPA